MARVSSLINKIILVNFLAFMRLRRHCGRKQVTGLWLTVLFYSLSSAVPQHIKITGLKKSEQSFCRCRIESIRLQHTWTRVSEDGVQTKTALKERGAAQVAHLWVNIKLSF